MTTRQSKTNRSSRDLDMYGLHSVIGKAGDHLGWKAEFVRHRQPYQRYFAVSRFGDSKAALDAARAWRDEMFQNIPARTKADASLLVRSNNTSGFPGVYLMVTVRKTEDGVRKHWMWQARTPEAIRPQRSKSYSISRYGHDEAYARAVAARLAFVRELGDEPLAETGHNTLEVKKTPAGSPSTSSSAPNCL